MRWYLDELEQDYYDMLYDLETEVVEEDEDENDKAAQYFDVPEPYRPNQWR